MGLSDMAPEPYEDPGWLRPLMRIFTRVSGQAGQSGAAGVVFTRSLFMSLSGAAFAILVVTIIIIKQVGTPNLGLGSAIMVLGFVGIGLSAWTTRRPLDVASASALAKSYRTNLFIGIAVCEWVLFLTFATSFVQQELWPYLIGLPMYLIGMAVIAPSERNIERRQEQVHQQGSTLSVGQALSALPGQLGG
jgi:hypothetical protein